MSDTISVTPPITEQQHQLKVFEAMAFGEPMPAPLDSTAAPAPQEAAAPAAATPVPDPASTAAAPPSPFAISDFGYTTVEELKAALDEYKTLKTTPATPQELQFANEESKKIHMLLKDGKFKEVKSYLDGQDLISQLEGMDEDKQLKQYYKMQNSLYDDEILAKKFERDFGFDEDEYKDTGGNIVDHVGYRLAKAEAAFKKTSELTKAKDFFAQYKSKIELPDIQQQATIDADYEAFKASIAKEAEVFNNVTVPSLKALKETDVPFTFKVEDANNQMNFDVNIVPDNADFEAARELALDFNTYLQTSFYDKDGKFQAAKLQRAILLEKNFDKYVQSAARQAVNAERTRVIAKETGGAGAARDYNTVTVPNELTKAADMAFSV